MLYTSLFHRRSAWRGLNEKQPVDWYIPASLTDTILHLTVRTRDQVPRFWTPI